MARYNPYGSRIAQPEMIDTGDVPYISYQSENFLPMVSQGMGEMQKRYDITQSAMAKYIEENAALIARGADYQNVMGRLDEELANIKATVKDTYGGDYGAAMNEVVKKLGKARGIYHQAQQEYERTLPYEQEMAKLQREGKLLFTPDAQGNIVDPRTQVAFDERGNYTPVDYNRFRERSDYVKAAQPLVEKVNKLIKEDPRWRSKYGYLGAVTLQGLNALDKGDLDALTESYAPIFEQETTYGIDPMYRDKMSSKDFLKRTIESLATRGEKADWMKDWEYEKQLENAGKNTPQPTLDPMFTFSAIEGVVPQKYLENAKQEYSGLKGRSYVGNMLINNAKRLAEWNNPDKWKQLGYGLTSILSPSIEGKMFGESQKQIYKNLVKKDTEEFNKNIDNIVTVLENKINTNTASPREKKYYSWLKDDTNQNTPLGRAVIKRYNLNNPSNDIFKEKMKEYNTEFSTASTSPKIEIDYKKDKSGNLDLDNLENTDKLYFGLNKDGAPTLTGAVVNTKLYDIQTGELLNGSEFIKEHSEEPVKGYAKYTDNNPYAPGAKQVIVATKKGPKVYAMIPSDEEVSRRNLSWMFNQAHYLPEQEVEFETPNIHGSIDKIKIVNTATGKEGKTNPIYEMYINGEKVTLTDNRTKTGTSQIKNIGGYSAGDIAYKVYLDYLRKQNKE